jgi:hypothetical protein
MEEESTKYKLDSCFKKKKNFTRSLLIIIIVCKKKFIFFSSIGLNYVVISLNHWVAINREFHLHSQIK